MRAACKQGCVTVSLPGGSPRAVPGPGTQTRTPQNAARALMRTEGERRLCWGIPVGTAPALVGGCPGEAPVPARFGGCWSREMGIIFFLEGRTAPRCPPLLGVSPGQRRGPGGLEGGGCCCCCCCARALPSCAGMEGQTLRGTLCSWLRVSLHSGAGKGGEKEGDFETKWHHFTLSYKGAFGREASREQKLSISRYFFQP